MNARVVYLAGPIYEQDDTCIRWRQVATSLLRKKNIMSVKPTDADYRGKEQDKYIPKRIVDRDKSDIMMCDTILAKCDHPSYGTAMEIMFAWSLQKQIAIVTNSFSPWIRYHATEIFPTVADAIEAMEFPDLDPGISK